MPARRRDQRVGLAPAHLGLRLGSGQRHHLGAVDLAGLEQRLLAVADPGGEAAVVLAHVLRVVAHRPTQVEGRVGPRRAGAARAQVEPVANPEPLEQARLEQMGHGFAWRADPIRRAISNRPARPFGWGAQAVRTKGLEPSRVAPLDP